MAWIPLICLLLMVGSTVGKPQSLSDTFAHALQRRSGECETLARRSDRFLNYIIVHQLSHALPPGIPPRQVIQRATGIDLVRPSEMRRVVCRLTEVTDVDGIVGALDDLGITYNEIRFLYDYLAAAYTSFGRGLLESMVQGIPEDSDDPMHALMQASLDILDIAEDAGLDQLDPEGITWMLNMMPNGPGGPGGPGGNRRTMRKRQGSQCDQAFDLLSFIMDITLFNPPGNEDTGRPNHGDQVVAVVQQWTGIDLRNNDQMRALVCEALEINDLQGIVDILDDHQIFNRVMTAAYPLIVGVMGQAYQENQDLLEQADNQDSSDRVQFARVFVPWYEAVQASGVLSLPA